MAKPAGRVVKTLGGNLGTVAWSLSRGTAFFLRARHEQARAWSLWYLDRSSGFDAAPSAMFSVGLEAEKSGHVFSSSPFTWKNTPNAGLAFCYSILGPRCLVA